MTANIDVKDLCDIVIIIDQLIENKYVSEEHTIALDNMLGRLITQIPEDMLYRKEQLEFDFV